MISKYSSRFFGPRKFSILSGPKTLQSVSGFLNFRILNFRFDTKFSRADSPLRHSILEVNINMRDEVKKSLNNWRLARR